MFAGQDEQEKEYRPDSLLIFDQGEPHTVRALDEELIFVSFLQGIDGMRPKRTSGEIGRE